MNNLRKWQMKMNAQWSLTQQQPPTTSHSHLTRNNSPLTQNEQLNTSSVTEMTTDNMLAQPQQAHTQEQILTFLCHLYFSPSTSHLLARWLEVHSTHILGRPVWGQGEHAGWTVAGGRRDGPGSGEGMLVLGEARRGWDESSCFTTFVTTNKYIKVCDSITITT